MPPPPMLSEDAFGRMYADVAGLAPEPAWAEAASPKRHRAAAAAAALDGLGAMRLLHSRSFSLGDGQLSPSVAHEALAGLSPRHSLPLLAGGSLQGDAGAGLRPAPSGSSQLAAQLAHMDVARPGQEAYGVPRPPAHAVRELPLHLCACQPQAIMRLPGRHRARVATWESRLTCRLVLQTRATP